MKPVVFEVFVLAVAFFSSAASIPSQEQNVELQVWDKFCSTESAACRVLKRAAFAVGQSLLDNGQEFSDPAKLSCYAKGGPCNIARREALAMAEAVAEAYVRAYPTVATIESKRNVQGSNQESAIISKTRRAAFRQWCHHAGEICMRGRDAPQLEQWCSNVGPVCTNEEEKVRRAAEALAWVIEAGYDPYRTPKSDRKQANGPEITAKPPLAQQWCHGVGEICPEKRALDHLAEFVKPSKFS